jgi:hypothetical protein
MEHATHMDNAIMRRVGRVYLMKKLCGKFCMFIAASMIGMTFVSTIDVLRNALKVAAQHDLQAIFNFIWSAFTHTEHITYVAMTLSLTAIIWMMIDIVSTKTTLKMRRIEFL